MDEDKWSGAALREESDRALAFRLTEVARRGHRDGPEWDAIQAELARRRVASLGSATPLRQSLRAKTLSFLQDAPGCSPSQIAQEFDRSTAVVSRVLSTLLGEGLVEYDADPNDRRVRRYRLVEDAELVVNGVVAEPTERESDRQYVGLVIATAVRARRRTNDLEYSADRLSRALRRSTTIGADDLALLALRELITTLRQAGRVSELEEHLEHLQRMEQGAEQLDPRLALPAIGVLNYELGRMVSRPALERYKHLTTSATVFKRCESLREASDWCPREGWALLATADLWREQTEFGVAFAYAEQSAEIFRHYDDTYGAAEAVRVQGFCQRLRGNFEDAIFRLKNAAVLAQETSADRCLADILLQLGDAYRCVGRLSEACEHLHESIAIASKLGRRHTIGFARSALAATYFADGNLDDAWQDASGAVEWLATSSPGTALNVRRMGVVARELGADGRPALLVKSMELFQDASRRYTELGSPAGVAACCVGLGRLDAGQGVADSAIARLVNVASTSRGRLLLPLDPWVPSILQTWAEESGRDDVRRVADWTFSTDRENAFDTEMAAEPRLQSNLLAA